MMRNQRPNDCRRVLEKRRNRIIDFEYRLMSEEHRDDENMKFSANSTRLRLDYQVFRGYVTVDYQLLFKKSNPTKIFN